MRIFCHQNLCEYNQEKSIQYSRQSDEKGDGQTQKRMQEAAARQSQAVRSLVSLLLYYMRLMEGNKQKRKKLPHITVKAAYVSDSSCIIIWGCSSSCRT